jgi:hypothetical protein
MKDVKIIVKVPPEIIKKVDYALQKPKSFQLGWKKLSGLSSYLANRLDNNYRILLSSTGNAKVSNHHDYYYNKINNLK